MEVILTPSQMRAYDSHAARALSIPAVVLMENAGAGASRRIESNFGTLTGRRIVIVAGKGNNGEMGLSLPAI